MDSRVCDFDSAFLHSQWRDDDIRQLCQRTDMSSAAWDFVGVAKVDDAVTFRVDA
jgi:hypothetical protein